jgi:hypothetical protein
MRAIRGWQGLRNGSGSLRSLAARSLTLTLQYWCHIAHNLADTHELVPEICYCCEVHPSDGCCRGVRRAHNSSAAWRRSQEAFYRQLLVALEEEKAAWQHRRPVTAAPLPALPEMPMAEWVLPRAFPAAPLAYRF